METVTPVFATVYLLSRLLLTQGIIVQSKIAILKINFSFSCFLRDLLLTYTATVIFEHPQDVIMQPNEWANFSCTVEIRLSGTKLVIQYLLLSILLA